MPVRLNKIALEELYRKYNRREFVHPDPLEFLYNYSAPEDIEIVGLVASSLAYGRVAQILRSVALVLDRMGSSPRAYLEKTSPVKLVRDFVGYKHRFTTGDELSGMLHGAKMIIEREGTLGEYFAGLYAARGALPTALQDFACELNMPMSCSRTSLVPQPDCGSACKRLYLYLRWMVRRDDVDPGGWEGVPPSALIIPLDTHIHRICTALGLTSRKPADLRTAVEITNAFRTISPNDPVRYDFSITRLGIRTDTDLNAFLRRYLKK